jgi:hypothetical protein
MNSYNYSYNVLINRLEAFAAGHFLIKRFTHGQIDLADMDQDEQYPFMHVVPNNITPVDGGMQFDFQIIFADIPRDKELKAEYQREVISDCVRLAQDLIAEVKNGLQLFGFDVQLVTNPTIEPFMEEYKNTLTGVTFSLQLEVPWDWSACDIPAIWSVGGASGSGGSGTGYGITLRTNGVDNAVQNILDLVEGTNVTITDNGDGSVTIDAAGGGGGGGEYVSTEYNVNHVTALGNPYVIGDRVWYNGSVYRCIANNDAINPSNPTYWTLQSVGYRLRQSPVDWNASSGDYQILNKPTLATVATTGDYNDLDNLPTIPVNLNDLDDVETTGVTNGQVLTYNTTSALWEAQTPAAGGTVTSVALTVPNAFSVAGSPITTAGTLAITAVGTVNQYITGSGEIANFPTITSGTVTSVGLTMPSPTNAAFSVTGSPVTASGTLAVGANGTVDQYIDGTGALRTLPSTGGGGGQVFYFNGNIPQGTIGGNDYYQLGTAANTGPAANFTRATTGAIARFITSVGSPNHTIIPAGVWTIDVYLSESGGGANHAQILAKLYVYNGSTFTLIATSTMEEITNGNVPDLYTFTISVPTTVTAATDRIHIEFDIQNTNGKTVTLYTESNKIGEVHTTFAIGISSLNGLTESTQNFAVGTTGTDFAISSAGSTHTFNLPTASAANRGALSSADWSTFNGKLTGNAPIIGATNTKITYDSKGLVTAGTSLAAGDMPTGIDAANIGSGAVSNTEFGYLDGVTSAIQTQLDNKKDSFTIRMAVGPAAPADNITYYFGEAALSLSTVATLWDNKIAFACKLVGAQIMANNSTGTATAETSTLYLRINNTTDVLLSNAVVFTGVPPTSTSYTVTGLSQTIAANDELTIKWVTPTWATNPANAQIVVTLFFERT